MLALFAEGERLLRLVEEGAVDDVILELPIWQDQVMIMMQQDHADIQDSQWFAQVQMLQEVAQKIMLGLANMSQVLQKEMNAVQKQHSSAKAYISNSYEEK